MRILPGTAFSAFVCSHETVKRANVDCGDAHENRNYTHPTPVMADFISSSSRLVSLSLPTRLYRTSIPSSHKICFHKWSYGPSCPVVFVH